MSGVASKITQDRAKDSPHGSINNPVKYADQDYLKLRADCLDSELFEDPVFPAGPDSMGYDKYGKDSENVKGLAWERPQEIMKNPVFIVGGANKEDIRQGNIGDCWLLSSIACLTMNQDCLFRVVPSDQSFHKDYAGIFHFLFWQYGQWVDVVIDDKLPTKNDKLTFVKSITSYEFWSPLLEKAYAKINGSYEALEGGYAVESLVDFTGGVGEVYETKSAPADLFQRIQRALNEKSLTASSTGSGKGDREDITKTNIVTGHMYSITGAEEVACDGKVIQIIRVRNPWGFTEWNGAFSDNAPEWNKVNHEVKAKLYVKQDDGEVWMPFADYLREFKLLEICNIHLSEACCGDSYNWCLTEFTGRWTEGISDGGGLHLDTFWINPQYGITLKAPDGDVSKKCTVIVSLTQKDRRKKMSEGLAILNIGFYIFEVKPSDNNALGKEFLSKNAPVSEKFGFYRDVSGRFELLPGDYVIMVATYSAAQRADFYLRVFTEKPTGAHG